MEKIVRIIFAAIIIIGSVTPAFGENNDNMDRIIIGVEHAGLKENILDVIKKYNGEVLEEIPAINAVIVNIPSKLHVALNSDAALNKYARYIEDDRIISIPPNEITMAPVNSILLIPDDPLYASLWGMRMIQANYTWDVTTGNRNIIVAVIDTGADYDHEDLSAVNASLGWDYVNNDADPMDDNGHGTHVAGTVAAAINNGKGVVGVAPGITIMPLKVLDSKGSGRTSDIANAITYAADHNAKIISMSLGSWFPSKAMEDATKYAVYTKGALVIAAAGNDGLKLNTYPAAYNWVLAVAAVGYDGNRAAYSNYGPFVDIAAPGGSNDGNSIHDILSTWPGNAYAYAAGTSMATPHTSGVAALYWSYNPSLTNVQIASALIKNADDKGAAGRDDYYGYGIVDAWPANG